MMSVSLVPSRWKARLARGTVNVGDWRFPDHYCFCSRWNRTLTPHSITLRDEVEEERMNFITVPGLDVFITQTYCDFLPLSSFFILSFLFSLPVGVRNILGQILNVLNDLKKDPKMPPKSKEEGHSLKPRHCDAPQMPQPTYSVLQTWGIDACLVQTSFLDFIQWKLNPKITIPTKIVIHHDCNICQNNHNMIIFLRLTFSPSGHLGFPFALTDWNLMVCWSRLFSLRWCHEVPLLLV